MFVKFILLPKNINPFLKNLKSNNDIIEVNKKLKITKYAKCNLIKLKITNDIKKYFKLFFIKERIKTENKKIVIVSFEIPELQKL